MPWTGKELIWGYFSMSAVSTHGKSHASCSEPWSQYVTINNAYRPYRIDQVGNSNRRHQNWNGRTESKRPVPGCSLPLAQGLMTACVIDTPRALRISNRHMEEWRRQLRSPQILADPARTSSSNFDRPRRLFHYYSHVSFSYQLHFSSFKTRALTLFLKHRHRCKCMMGQGTASDKHCIRNFAQ